MIQFFVRGNEPEKILLREELLREYQFFKTGTGRFQYLFEEKIDAGSDEDDFPQFAVTNRKLNLNAVSRRIEASGEPGEAG